MQNARVGIFMALYERRGIKRERSSYLAAGRSASVNSGEIAANLSGGAYLECLYIINGIRFDAQRNIWQLCRRERES